MSVNVVWMCVYVCVCVGGGGGGGREGACRANRRHIWFNVIKFQGRGVNIKN